jgi:hypothetical protein
MPPPKEPHMNSSGVLATLIAAVFVLGACGSEDEPTGKQRATELSADQPLSPSPLPTETAPETPEQTAEDVAAAREQAGETRSQVRMAAKVADAESAHRIATEKCQAVQGAERTACIEQADRELAAVKKSETERVESEQR